MEQADAMGRVFLGIKCPELEEGFEHAGFAHPAIAYRNDFGLVRGVSVF